MCLCVRGTMVSVMQKLKNRGCIIVKDLVTNRPLQALKSQRTLQRPDVTHLQLILYKSQ